MSKFEKEDKIRKYETFLNERLRGDLKKVFEERDKVHAKISEYEQLITICQKFIEQDLVSEELKTQIDIGCNFYVRAKVESLKTIMVNIGFGLYLELTPKEAIDFCEKKISELNKSVDSYSNQSHEIKARIKLVLEGLRELQGIESDLNSNNSLYDPFS